MVNKTALSGGYLEKIRMNQKTLMLAGILGPIVFVLNVVLGGIITPDHSHIKNAVSELTQRGAPNIVLLSAFFVLSAILMFIFGMDLMRRFRHQNKRVYAGAILIAVYGVFAVLLATVFPQDPIGAEITFPGTMHLVFAGLSAFVIMAAIIMIGLGMDQPVGHWDHFKLYSFITIFVMLAFGASTPILIMNEIELLGLFERITQLAYLQWFVVFALKSYTQPVMNK